MIIDLTERPSSRIYHAMVQTIIPRPIAWVLSDNGNGSYNLAPFSYFNGVCSRPPVIMISVGRKADGSSKDTWVNIDERNEFVVHIAPRSFAKSMVASSAALPFGESELSRLGLDTTVVEEFRLPRLIGPQVAMCCERYAIHEIGDGPQGMILGRILQLWIDDEAAEEKDGRLIIDPHKVDPVARLGGEDYALFGETTTIARPK